MGERFHLLLGSTAVELRTTALSIGVLRGENNSTAGGPGRFNLAERGLSAIQSPRNPKGLSHCIFECLIVEASSQAQNHLSVLADRYTEGCGGVFDCTGDG